MDEEKIFPDEDTEDFEEPEDRADIKGTLAHQEDVKKFKRAHFERMGILKEMLVDKSLEVKDRMLVMKEYRNEDLAWREYLLACKKLRINKKLEKKKQGNELGFEIPKERMMPDLDGELYDDKGEPMNLDQAPEEMTDLNDDIPPDDLRITKNLPTAQEFLEKLKEEKENGNDAK